MSKVLDDAVRHEEDDSWTFQCPGIQGSPCGDLGSGQPFHSRGWPTKRVARARGAQHFAEHKTGAPMQDIEEFRADHKLVAHADGVRAVSIEDLP